MARPNPARTEEPHALRRADVGPLLTHLGSAERRASLAWAQERIAGTLFGRRGPFPLGFRADEGSHAFALPRPEQAVDLLFRVHGLCFRGEAVAGTVDADRRAVELRPDSFEWKYRGLRVDGGTRVTGGARVRLKHTEQSPLVLPVHTVTPSSLTLIAWPCPRWMRPPLDLAALFRPAEGEPVPLALRLAANTAVFPSGEGRLLLVELTEASEAWTGCVERLRAGSNIERRVAGAAQIR